MIGATSDRQNPLVDDDFSSSMPKKGEQSSAYQNTFEKKQPYYKWWKQSDSVTYEDIVNKLRREYSAGGIFLKRKVGNLIHIYYRRQAQ